MEMIAFLLPLLVFTTALCGIGTTWLVCNLNRSEIEANEAEVSDELTPLDKAQMLWVDSLEYAEVVELYEVIVLADRLGMRLKWPTHLEEYCVRRV